MRVINRRSTKEPWVDDPEVVKQKEKEQEAWQNWKEQPDIPDNKEQFEREKKRTKILINNCKSKQIQKEIIAEPKGNTGRLWKAMRDTLNWREGGPPTELRLEGGKLSSNLKEVCNIYHKNLDNKVNKMARSLEKYEGSLEEEHFGLKRQES